MNSTVSGHSTSLSRASRRRVATGGLDLRLPDGLRPRGRSGPSSKRLDLLYAVACIWIIACLTKRRSHGPGCRTPPRRRGAHGVVPGARRTGRSCGHPRPQLLNDSGGPLDAVTSAERIPRWFLPVSGRLELGGRYQLEGNAGGTIRRCERPSHLGLTWELGGDVSWWRRVCAATVPAARVLRLRIPRVVRPLAQVRFRYRPPQCRWRQPSTVHRFGLTPEHRRCDDGLDRGERRVVMGGAGREADDI